jgi:hypothetical protein
MRGVEYDIHQKVEEDPLIAAIHANAEKWDPDTEFIFGFLQVVSAICVIFAHGAGEVGYMAGPLAVIVNIVTDPANNVATNTKLKANPEIWVVLIGAFGLIIGLATYGYKVCASVGTQMAKITPSRGYAAELATSFVIMIAAQYALPTSSSQCITGGIIGIAVFEGSKGINFRLLGMTAMSWIWTMVVMGLGTSLIFSQGIYTPSKWVQLEFNPILNTAFVTCATQDLVVNQCSSKQFKTGCQLNYTDGRAYNLCSDCSKVEAAAAAAAGPMDYFTGCGGFVAGGFKKCSNSSWSAPSCTTQQYLTNCTKQAECKKKP